MYIALSYISLISLAYRRKKKNLYNHLWRKNKKKAMKSKLLFGFLIRFFPLIEQYSFVDQWKQVFCPFLGEQVVQLS